MMKKAKPRKPASYITHQIAILIPYWKLDLKLDICRFVAEVDFKMGALHEISVGKGFPNMFCCSKLELLLMEEIRLTTWDVKNLVNTGDFNYQAQLVNPGFLVAINRSSQFTLST